MAEAFSFNPLDPDLRRDPYALYARGRRESPVLLHEGLPVRLYSVFLYEDCRAILRDAGSWSSKFRDDDHWDQPQYRDLGPQPPPSMLMTDGDDHARLRGLVNKAFTPRIVQRLEGRLHEIAHELVDAALDAGEVDLVQALTYPLPVTMIAEIIGVPSEEREQFKQWSDQVAGQLGTGLFGGLDVEAVRAQRRLLKTMRDYFVPLAEERRRDPREDLLTGLVQARHEGSRLSEDEMLSMLGLILIAGNETTTNLIGNSVVTLLEHPDQLAKLREKPDLMSSAVEEVLRFSSPVQFDPRQSSRSQSLRDRKIEEGAFVLCWLGSANRDEAVFERSDVFDITRPPLGHLAFGFGVHHCLGANLARLETEVAIGALLERTRHIERVDDEPLPLHPSPVFRGVTKLPLRLTPA
ncbi:MAG: cytochrome P450 [Myxococcales bacterium]|nr:cytochrome P450 [Myxococcales bacterium]